MNENLSPKQFHKLPLFENEKGALHQRAMLNFIRGGNNQRRPEDVSRPYEIPSYAKPYDTTTTELLNRIRPGSFVLHPRDRFKEN